ASIFLPAIPAPLSFCPPFFCRLPAHLSASHLSATNLLSHSSALHSATVLPAHLSARRFPLSAFPHLPLPSGHAPNGFWTISCVSAASSASHGGAAPVGRRNAAAFGSTGLAAVRASGPSGASRGQRDARGLPTVAGSIACGRHPGPSFGRLGRAALRHSRSKGCPSQRRLRAARHCAGNRPLA